MSGLAQHGSKFELGIFLLMASSTLGPYKKLAPFSRQWLNYNSHIHNFRLSDVAQSWPMDGTNFAVFRVQETLLHIVMTRR